MIPIAAGSTILALGCSPERSAAHKYCKTWKDCDEESFKEEYDSVAQCTKSGRLYNEAYNYSLKVRISKDCAQASRKYDSCRAKALTCDAFPQGSDDWDAYSEWRDSFEKDCKDEIEEYDKACEDDDYYEYYGY